MLFLYLIATPKNRRCCLKPRGIIEMNNMSAVGIWNFNERNIICELEADFIASELIKRHIISRPFSSHQNCSTQQLFSAFKNFFEEQLGYDLSHVRIYDDVFAAKAAADLGAIAFTYGRDIYLSAGCCQSHSMENVTLLAHEIVHVIQQKSALRYGPSKIHVECRVSPRIQMLLDPKRIYDSVCPPGYTPTSYPSEGLLGTAYGKWLGLMYIQERNPDPYCIVDFWIRYRGRWGKATIFDLPKLDPGVALAFVNLTIDRTWRWPDRPDILDAERSEVYEIKPVRNRDNGVAQLKGYIDQLNLTASTTGPIFSSPRSRLWRGGTWDPSGYPLVIPGAKGRICMIHAWKDPLVQGLILYDIVCCNPSDDDEDRDEIVDTVVSGLAKPFLNAKPKFEMVLKEYLPKAPRGSSYAFLVTPRIFETYVIGPEAREQDKLLEKAYGLRPGPVHQAFILQLFILSHILPTHPLSDPLFITSGFMRPDEVYKLWKIEAAGSVIAGAGLAAGGMLLVGTEMATAAGVSTEVGAAAADVLAAEAAGEVVVTTSSIGVGIGATPVASALTSGDIIVGELITGAIVPGEIAVGEVVAGEAIVAGSSVPPWMIGSMSSGVGSSIGTGLGIVGIIVTAFVSGDAQAATGSSTSPLAKIAGTDELFLTPTELLVPKRGKIEIGAEIAYGGKRYFIVGLATASGGV